MQLSEAVLLGLPEIKFTNSMWLFSNQDGSCEGCLVGAALFAMGNHETVLQPEGLLAAHWPWTIEFSKRNTSVVCPFCSDAVIISTIFGISALLTHFASHYRYGRVTAEQIADEIRKIEPADVEATPETIAAMEHDLVEVTT